MKGNWKKYAGVLVPLALVVAAPLLLRNPGEVGAQNADLRLEILVPHNESIRREFGETFARWYEEKHGKSVYVSWRTPGGTSEIKRVMDSAFAAAEKNGRAGIGVDLFFGGGEYDFSRQAREGRLVKLDVFADEAALFSEAVIPEMMSGERYYSKNRDWVGVCLSSFGICYNRDGLKRRGLAEPRHWDDLGDARYFQGLALADPTKSGSVAKAFEMLLQEKIHAQLAAGLPREEALAQGWREGMNLIQRISANARYFADSATKIPHDVAQGNAVAGMCIDFYGRTYSASVKRADGSSRMQFVSPVGGTSISVDPVAVLKGAPHEELAQEFVRFLLSKEGQMRWDARAGSEFGPKDRSLRRLPIRRDLYRGETLAMMVDGAVDPYGQAKKFTYDASLTGHLFSPLRLIVRVMCIDVHEEMSSAWAALAAADFPPEASAAFFDISPVSYREAASVIKKTQRGGDKVAEVRLGARLSAYFRAQYRKAERLARAGR